MMASLLQMNSLSECGRFYVNPIEHYGLTLPEVIQMSIHKMKVKVMSHHINDQIKAILEEVESMTVGEFQNAIDKFRIVETLR